MIRRRLYRKLRCVLKRQRKNGKERRGKVARGVIARNLRTSAATTITITTAAIKTDLLEGTGGGGELKPLDGDHHYRGNVVHLNPLFCAHFGFADVAMVSIGAFEDLNGA